MISYSRMFLIVPVLMILSSFAHANTYRVINVATNDVLNVRSESTAKSLRVGALAYDASGITLTGAEAKLGKSHWVEIKYNSISGWVNKRFITQDSSSITQQNLSVKKKLSPPQVIEKPVQVITKSEVVEVKKIENGLENLRCIGGEPNWVMAFDLINKSIELDSPAFKRKVFTAREIKRSHNATNQWFIDASNGEEISSFAVSKTNQCSDDMSDSPYKYGIIINTLNDGVFSGCCNRMN